MRSKRVKEIKTGLVEIRNDKDGNLGLRLEEKAFLMKNF